VRPDVKQRSCSSIEDDQKANINVHLKKIATQRNSTKKAIAICKYSVSLTAQNGCNDQDSFEHFKDLECSGCRCGSLKTCSAGSR
jgi:hypothetical protein